MIWHLRNMLKAYIAWIMLILIWKTLFWSHLDYVCSLTAEFIALWLSNKFDVQFWCKNTRNILACRWTSLGIMHDPRHRLLWPIIAGSLYWYRGHLGHGPTIPDRSTFTWCSSHHDRTYSLSNVISVDEKFTAFNQYLRYCHKRGTIVFTIPGTILWA